MRTSTFFAGIAASAALSMGLVGVASAAPATTTATSAAALFVSPTSAAPGATVQISGTCAMPTSGTDFPTVTSVTSPAFSSQASFINKAPDSFSGTARIASVNAGSYPVTLTCSNGSATSTVQVTGGAPKPTPNPAPAPSGSGTHHSSTTGGTGESTSSTGGDSGEGTFSESDTTVNEQSAAEQDSGWSGWEIAGVAVLGIAAAGVGGYAVARRNRQRNDV